MDKTRNTNKNRMIPLSVPSIKGNEWKYIKECLDTEWVSSAGKYVELFEQKICEYTGAKYAVAVVNGTSALQVSLRVAGVEADDEVIVPTLTFIAPINAVRYLNAEPVFMDADEYYNIDIKKTIEFIIEKTTFKNGYSYNKESGRRIPAILPVHVYGNAVDLEQLLDLCSERKIKIIEDATESLGTCYTSGSLKGVYTGLVGDIGCYSFNGNKIITTGGGGMIVTNNKEYADKARYLTTQAKDNPLYYIHNEVGYNFRLTNLQAALGVAQMERLPEFLDIKSRNYQKYKSLVENIAGLHIAETPDYASSNHWMYCIQIDKETYGMDRGELMKRLSEEGIETRPVWLLNHLQMPYKDCYLYKIKRAQSLVEKTLNLPCSVGLSEGEIEYIITALRKCKI